MNVGWGHPKRLENSGHEEDVVLSPVLDDLQGDVMVDEVRI